MYYLINFRCKDYYYDDQKIIVKSVQELKEHIKDHIETVIIEFPELEKILRKRPTIDNMYQDPDQKIVGKVIKFGKKGKLTDQQIEDFEDTSYITYWCHKVSKRDLHKFAGFQK